MEEILECEMAQVRLEENFDAEQWEAIRKRRPKDFQNSQVKALECMLKDRTLYDTYFARFSQNHATLIAWHAAATRLKPQLEQYTLKKRRVEFANDKLKKAVEDPHALYLSTFHACNGWKYIYYNYERHMKGASQRGHHNQNIRTNEAKQLFFNSQQHPLRNFAEAVLPAEKTTMLSFRKVLADSNINSQKGFNKLLKNQVQKLVFVNHQRKPINYILKPQTSIG